MIKNLLTIAGIALIGALGGFAYYYFIGCNAGNTCPITSNPFSSMAYGALLGGVIGLNFTPSQRKKEKK
jgi:hypothetical protein